MKVYNCQIRLKLNIQVALVSVKVAKYSSIKNQYFFLKLLSVIKQIDVDTVNEVHHCIYSPIL